MRNSTIFLKQSHARIEEVSRRVSVRGFQEKPVVHFQYSHRSKEQEMRESLALDQELYLLRKEVQNKRGVIANLHNQPHSAQK